MKNAAPHYFPYIELAILIWITFEILNLGAIRNRIVRVYYSYGAKVRVINYVIIFVIGGGLACLYLWLATTTAPSVISFLNKFSSAETTPVSTETTSQTDQRIAGLGERIDNLVNTLAQSPSVDPSTQLSILRDEHNRLSEKRDELTKQEKESLKDQALTLQSLEKGRKQHLEKVQVEKRQQELAQQQAKIEREAAQKKAQEANDLRERQFAEQYVPIVDHTITTLYRLLRDVSKEFSEQVFTDFPNDHASVYDSRMLSDGKIVDGEHFIRVGSNEEWEFRVRIAGTPRPDMPVSRRYLGFHIQAGMASVQITNPRPMTRPPFLLVSLQIQPTPKEPKELYKEECSFTDYKKPIERVLIELIKNRYNEAPLKPKT